MIMIAQNDSQVVAAIRVPIVLIPDRVRNGYVLWVWLWVRLRVRLRIKQWVWVRLRRTVRWIAVSVRRVPGAAQWVYRSVWVVEIGT